MPENANAKRSGSMVLSLPFKHATLQPSKLGALANSEDVQLVLTGYNVIDSTLTGTSNAFER